MKKVLVMAAGPYKYGWTEKSPKHLALVEGKPLIVRTLDQLSKRGLDNATVITRNKNVQNVVRNYFEPSSNYWWTQTLMSTQELWSDWTAIVNGDTIYSDIAMDMLAAEQGPLMFIGDSIHNEILVFTADMNSRIIAAAETASEYAYRREAEPLSSRFALNYDQGRHTMHFVFYRSIAGLPLENLEDHIYEEKIHKLLPIKDYTHDIDRVQQYNRFLEKHTWSRK